MRVRTAALPCGAYRAQLAFLLLAMLAVLATWSRPAASAAQNDGAVLLVATQKVASPLWGRTVLLAAPGPGGMHVGVILNKPIETSLGTMFPEHEASQRVHEPVRFGGPFNANVIVALVRQSDCPQAACSRAFELSDELRMAVDRRTIDAIIEESGDRARYFIGFVVWRNGELDAEISAGAWKVQAFRDSAVFDSGPGGMWEDLNAKERMTFAAVDRPARR